MKLGARKHLEQEDLWDIAPHHQAARLLEQYFAAMHKTARPERFPHVRTASVLLFGMRCETVLQVPATSFLDFAPRLHHPQQPKPVDNHGKRIRSIASFFMRSV